MKPEPRPSLLHRIPDATVFTHQGRGPMPVLMIAEQPNMNEGTYASTLEPLMPLLRSANGFMSHAGGPSPAGGTRIIEIWESEADQQKFFNENLKPNLPPGAVPDITYYELQAAFTR
jgi:hypothetical protein